MLCDFLNLSFLISHENCTIASPSLLIFPFTAVSPEDYPGLGCTQWECFNSVWILRRWNFFTAGVGFYIIALWIRTWTHCITTPMLYHYATAVVVNHFLCNNYLYELLLWYNFQQNLPGNRFFWCFCGIIRMLHFAAL